MAVLLKNAIFYHMPKTGGTWVRHVLEQAGIAHKELLCDQCAAKENRDSTGTSPCCYHATHLHTMLPKDGRKRFVFMFVRHPLAYYQSYWAFKMQQGWDRTSEFDRKCAQDNFQMFVRAVLRERPWSFTQMVEDFAGPEGSPVADFIGKQETLRLDLLRVLQRAGENVDSDWLMHFSPVNEVAGRSEWKDRCQYTPELREAVCEAERGMMTRFGYW